MKKENGITLISLVVTIIVLIILAGISINLLLGENGIITRAKYAKETYTNAQISEEENLDNLYRQILNADLPVNTPNTQAGTLVQIPNSWYADGKMNAYAVATGNGKEVPVPIGFYYVGGTIDSGVVISDNENDKDKYAGREDVPTGVEYKDDGTVKTYDELTEEERGEVLLGNQFVWIPVTLENYKKEVWTKSNDGVEYKNIKDWDNTTDSSELPQIKKYEGFYIARYEAGTSNISLSTKVKFEDKNEMLATNWSNDKFSIRDGLGHTYTGSITSKAGEIPYYCADYFTALELSNNMYETNYVKSGLITGTMWDAIMNFIAGEDKTIVTSNCTWGNYREPITGVTYIAGHGRYVEVDPNTGEMASGFKVSDAQHHLGIRTTASTENVKQKNIYDIAGNLWEWTDEEGNTETEKIIVMRGGAFFSQFYDFPVCYRGNGPMNLSRINYGFRPALFMK